MRDRMPRALLRRPHKLEETMMCRTTRLNCLLLTFALAASPAMGQQGRNPTANEASLNAAGIRESSMVDLTMPSYADPAAVDLLFREGDPITTILQGLKDKGFHIEFKERHFTEEMTLTALPKSSRIDHLLQEILEPWPFRVYHTPLGKWVVTPVKPRKSSRTATRSNKD